MSKLRVTIDIGENGWWIDNLVGWCDGLIDQQAHKTGIHVVDASVLAEADPINHS